MPFIPAAVAPLATRGATQTFCVWHITSIMPAVMGEPFFTATSYPSKTANNRSILAEDVWTGLYLGIQRFRVIEPESGKMQVFRRRYYLC